MSPRIRSSKHASSAQRMRGSQSSKPRHVPDVAGLPNAASFAMDRENSFVEHNYTLCSNQSEYSSHAHGHDPPWAHTGHANRPTGDASFTYSGPHGDYSPSYASSLESSTLYADVSHWPSSDVA